MKRFALHLNGIAIVGALVASAQSASAQVVRGSVVDRSGLPAGGAVVTLSRAAADDSAAGVDVRTVLADASGAFSVTAPEPGRYRVIVRRIGWRPFRSDLLVARSGETIRLEVVLEALLRGGAQAALPEIRVTRATPCRTDVSDAARIATLWNDARTALLGAEASRSTGLAPTMLIRFTRQLDPRDVHNPVVLSEALQVFDHEDVGNTRGFRSLSGDSLSAVGYWRRINETTTTFHGPDGSALLSEAFVRDHCFRLVDAPAETDSVGLLFEPTRERSRSGAPPEIRGAIWFDAASSRLQRVEFNWIVLPGNAPTQNLGGELTFVWSSSGIVHVDRWRLRMPQDVTEIRGSRGILTRVRRLGIVEEGGILFVDSAATTAGTAEIYGDLRVDGRQPLSGGTVRVLGTSLTAVTDHAGRFRIADVPAGLRVVVADHPTTATFGMRAAALRVLLDAGENRNLSLRAPGHEDIAKNLCGESALADGRGLLKVSVVDSTTAQPIGGFRVRLISRGGTNDVAESETDASGSALFCELPPNQAFILVASDGAVLLSEFSLTRGQLASRQLWVAR